MMKKTFKNFKIGEKKCGFTLIELLIVISLIGILLAISLPALGAARKSARDSKRKADLEQIRSALEIYRADVGNYPNALSWSGRLYTTEDGTEIVYLETIPNDPLSSPYSYSYSRPTLNSYSLCAYLEACPNCVVSGCGSCGTATCNYRVTNP